MASQEEMMAKLTVYNFPPQPPNFDKVGRFYIAFAATWTFLLLCGMAICIANYRNPVIKIRCIPLSFGAILLLHAYWILAQIVYPIGMTMPLVLAYDIQYFFMGIYFPLGIALFHASNLRFLHVARMQRHFAGSEVRAKGTYINSNKSILRRIRDLEYTRRIMLFIGFGMVFQTLLTVAMWVMCKKYHPTFGVPGTEIKGATLPEQLIDLGRGWEWWPSLVWQFVWSWIVAPYLLWKSWGIRDTMGWRTQTIACCLASLHAVPMFLIASYVPAFQKVNAYYPPSQWIHLSIIIIEIFTVFVPIYQVVRMWSITRKVNSSNTKWETASTKSSVGSITIDWKSSNNSLVEKSRLHYLDEELGDRLLTMTALDYVLKDNPAPLQEFSANNDFSGENVAFLTRTAKWKASCPVMPEDGDQRLDVFNEALAIYIDFISIKDAEFPLNLSSRELKGLEAIFEAPARSVCGGSMSNVAVPFDVEAPKPSPLSDGLRAQPTTLYQYRGDVPETFSLAVFDHVQSQIKYLVLTNTWLKFVLEMQSRRRSSETERSDGTAESQETVTSRLSARLAKLLSDLGL